MTDSARRPDPDALLRRLQSEEARAKRGKLKVFFGFAPGVGKTYRMLQVARDLVSDQQLDVVVGLVETHRRSETAAMVLGLDLLPRRRVDYRGHTLEEFDLDAALARKPQVLLLDELAHTNAPGLRHAKRWQDVLEILDAGIDVFTTVNVQHVESLNDIVAQITGVQVRETVPDAVLDRADDIELVDIAPEELLQRLKEGKVYLPDQAQRAVDHFFQRGNLLALRELALRRATLHVSADVEAYREEQGVVATWPLGERILVCVGPAPSSARLIRAAARMAAGLRCPWIAAYVQPAVLGAASTADRNRLEAHLRLAEAMGATVTRLSSERIAAAIIACARKHNVTRIVIGKPTHSRWRDRLRGSLVDEVVRDSGEIEVHVTGGDERELSDAARAPRQAIPARARHYAQAVLLVGLTTGAAAGLRALLGVPDLAMLYLLAVMLGAIWLGRGPSLLAAALSVAAYDFFFVPPFSTFAVADARYGLTFTMMFIVGALVSEFTTRLRRHEQTASAREQRTAALFALSRDLGGVEALKQVALVSAQHAASTFVAEAFVLCPEAGGDLQLLGAFPAHAAFDPKEIGVAKWSFEHEQLAGFGTETLPGAATVCAPLRTGAAGVGVIALVLRDRTPLSAEQREFLEVFRRQVALALERARLAGEARNAALRAKTEEMRSSLLSAVSHDLRTPLAAITGAATALRDDERLEEQTRAELLGSICDEAERLEHLVANLLDMTRLQSGGVEVKREWVPLEEVIGSALTRLEKKLEGRAIAVRLPADLPLVSVDPVLFGQLFINLFENAAKYTPPASPIEVEAWRAESWVVVEVQDRGPGLAAGTEQRLFEKFYRGEHAEVAGAGLGLPICKGIAEAHGGSIVAENRAGGGAMFRVTIPIGGDHPSVAKGSSP